MFKIGEFSKLGQVSTRMLRHYDKLGLLKPSHTDRFTGYRYYTIDQLLTLHRILALKDLGLSLQQIESLLQADDVPLAQMQGMLRLKQAEIRQQLAEEQMRLQRVAARLRLLEQADEPAPYEFLVKPVPPQPIASIQMTVPHISEMGYYCAKLYGELYQLLAAENIAPQEPELTLYHNETYVEEDLVVETAVAISTEVLDQYDQHPAQAETLVLRELPAAEQVAAVMYEGPLMEMNAAVMALLRWIGLNRHAPCGPLRELHLSGPVHEGVDAGSVVTAVVELQMPIVAVA